MATASSAAAKSCSFPPLSAAFDDADTNHDNLVSYAEVRVFAVKYRAERDASGPRKPNLTRAPAGQAFQRIALRVKCALNAGILSAKSY
jgi:hypothetical protein